MKRSGTLPKYGLLDLLRALRDEGFTGYGDLESRDEQVRVYLIAGQVVFTRSSALRHSLPAYLLSQQALGRSELKSHLEAARQERMRFEAFLVERRLMEPQELRQAQDSLARYILSFAFGLTPVSYVLRPTNAPERSAFATPLDVESAFFRFIATRDTPEEEASLLRDCFAIPMHPLPGFARWEKVLREALAPAGDHRHHDVILDAIHGGGTTVSGLLEAGHDAFDVIRRVFALHRAGMVYFHDARTDRTVWDDLRAELEPAAPPPLAAIESTSAAEASAPSNVTVLPRAAETTGGVSHADVAEATRHPAEERIAETWAQLSESNLYDVLGLMPDAPVSAARDRFRALRLRYDPAAFGDIPLSAETQRALRSIAERLELAYRTLTDFERRSSYHASQQIDPRTLRVSLRSLFEADALMAEAAHHLKEGRTAEATSALREAVSLSPFDAAARAELAWAVYLTARRGPSGADVRSAVQQLLREAQELDARCEAVLRIRARVARMDGRMREALEGYQRMLAIHPHSREAARSLTEIRTLLNRPAVTPSQEPLVADDSSTVAPSEEVDPPPPPPDAGGESGGVVHRITGLFRRR